MLSPRQKQECVACRADATPVPSGDYPALLRDIPEWVIRAVDGVPRLTRDYAFTDFAAALTFAVRIGALAEEGGHHPEITVRWGGTTVAWWSHKIRDLHRLDFLMAAHTDALFVSASGT